MSNIALVEPVLVNPRVLLVEDDQAICEILLRGLRKGGLEAAVANSGLDAIRLKPEFCPDVVLVDLELPDTNGHALIKWLVAQGDCGVIVVSGMGDETDRILGLELGADDYVAKPANMRELFARIRAVHRRTSGRNAAPAAVQAVSVVGHLRIDRARRQVTTTDGASIPLTGAEYLLLESLADAKGAVVNRDHLSETALRRPWRAEDRSVDQLVLSLRQKLPPDADGKSLIQSIRGGGYFLRLAVG